MLRSLTALICDEFKKAEFLAFYFERADVPTWIRIDLGAIFSGEHSNSFYYDVPKQQLVRFFLEDLNRREMVDAQTLTNLSRLRPKSNDKIRTIARQLGIEGVKYHASSPVS